MGRLATIHREDGGVLKAIEDLRELALAGKLLHVVGVYENEEGRESVMGGHKTNTSGWQLVGALQSVCKTILEWSED